MAVQEPDSQMKALEDIGIAKAVRYVLYGWVTAFLHVALPPVRVWTLRLLGASIGRDTVIFDADYANLYHYGFRKLVIGDRCFIGDGAMLDVRGGLTMEDDVTVSNRAHIVTHMNVGFKGHPLQKAYPSREAAVTLRRGCYIGAGVIVLPGVTIGEKSVIGAGAVVHRDVPARSLAVGVPAKVRKKL